MALRFPCIARTKSTPHSSRVPLAGATRPGTGRGFTLIEILLAIFILGIVLSTVYASYTGTFRIIRETEYDAEIYGMARSALDRMARDLQSAAPWRGAFTFRTKPYSLHDREFMRLTFRAAAHVAFSEQEVPGGITVIEYGVEEDTEKEGYDPVAQRQPLPGSGKGGTLRPAAISCATGSRR